MLNVIFDIVLIFLIFYAFVCLSAKLTDFILRKEKTPFSHAVFLPDDNEFLEFNLRRAALRCNRLAIPLIIIDKSIDDEALFIIQALKKEFPIISIFSRDDYIKKFL